MDNTLRVVSYNCRGMPRKSNALCSRPSLHLLLDDTENDIVCVQETWYTKQDLEQLNSLHPAYHGTGVATIDNRDCLYHGHPPGGVSILWRVEFDRFITPIKFDLDWLTGIMFEQDGRKYAIICV